MGTELDIEGLRILRGLIMREYNWSAFKEYKLRHEAHIHYTKFLQNLSKEIQE